MNIEELRKLKIGVVLAGGGAKGAYQIGCWRVLRRYGIKPSMVSGTSVGALNAALISTDGFDAGSQLWKELRVFKVMGFKVLRLLLAPLWLFLTGYRLIITPVRQPNPGNRRWHRGFRLYLALFVLYAVPELWSYPPIILNTIAALLILTCLDPIIKYIVLNWGFTTNTPLQAEVETTFNDERLSNFRVPTFATLSFFKPYVRGSAFWDGWVPMYVRLDQLDFPTIRQVLLQSAGIPGIFPVRKVMGRETIDGGWCDNVPVAPLLYRVGEPLDLVFVIYLSASQRKPRLRRGFSLNPKPFTWDMNTGFLDVTHEAAISWRIHETANSPRRPSDWPYSADGDRNTQWSSRQIPHDPLMPHIISVVPSTSLGNVLTGTLNFSGRKARKLILRGVKDMRKVMKGLLQPNWTPVNQNVSTLERRRSDWPLVFRGHSVPVAPKFSHEDTFIG